MNITNDILNNQSQLSEVGRQFLEYVKNTPSTLQASSYKRLELNDDLFTLQPWPTFIGKEVREQFAGAASSLFRLCKSIPKRIFGNDPKKISDYYEISLDNAQRYVDGVTDDHLRHLVGRGDFTLSPTGLKCLEYNVTTTLGGWDVPVWESLYLSTPVIAQFVTQNAVTVLNQNLFQQFIEHVAIATLEKKSASGQMNILFVIPNHKIALGAKAVYLNQLFQQVIARKKLSVKGKVLIGDIHRLENKNNYLYYEGTPIHGLIEMYQGEITPLVTDVFKAGNVRLLNGPVSNLIKNKLNLALLSDHRNLKGNPFSKEEQECIDTYIPWTRKIADQDTQYRGQAISLISFIRSNKDSFVLKPGDGYGGKGVYIGRQTDQNQWEKAVAEAIKKKNWLVQEYVESQTFLYQHGENGCEPHDVTWGFFLLGNRYAGGWTRVLPVSSHRGVINCHAGARAGVIFEVEK